MELTRMGLQSGNYYYALKSLFQQEYKNFKVIVINSPEMHMLEDVNRLISAFPDINVTLIDKLITNYPLAASFYPIAVVRKYCKETNLTLMLRDNGELIGSQNFKVINKINHEFKPPVIFTNYLL
jgi:hypothetical protein